MQGREDDRAASPETTFASTRCTAAGARHGRDPYFPGGPDPAGQLSSRGAPRGDGANRSASRGNATAFAATWHARVPDVIERTWGERALPRRQRTGRHAVLVRAIERVRRQRRIPLHGEAYWIASGRAAAGIDYRTKRLYDRLRARRRRRRRTPPRRRGVSAPVCAIHRESRRAPRGRRFAPSVTPPRSGGAARPGLRLFTTGKRPDAGFARPIISGAAPRAGRPRARGVLRRRWRDAPPGRPRGDWHLAERAPAWEGNSTAQQIVAFTWERDDERLLVAVNYAPAPAQGYLRPAFAATSRWPRALERPADPRCATNAMAPSRRAGSDLDVPPGGPRFDVATRASPDRLGGIPTDEQQEQGGRSTSPRSRSFRRGRRPQLRHRPGARDAVDAATRAAERTRRSRGPRAGQLNGGDVLAELVAAEASVRRAPSRPCSVVALRPLKYPPHGSSTRTRAAAGLVEARSPQPRDEGREIAVRRHAAVTAHETLHAVVADAAHPRGSSSECPRG